MPSCSFFLHFDRKPSGYNAIFIANEWPFKMPYNSPKWSSLNDAPNEFCTRFQVAKRNSNKTGTYNEYFSLGLI